MAEKIRRENIEKELKAREALQQHQSELEEDVDDPDQVYLRCNKKLIQFYFTTNINHLQLSICCILPTGPCKTVQYANKTTSAR